MQDILELLKGTKQRSTRETPTIPTSEDQDTAEKYVKAKALEDSAKAAIKILKGSVDGIARAVFLRRNLGAEAPIPAVEWRIGTKKLVASIGPSYSPTDAAMALLDPAFVRTTFSLEIDGDSLTPEQARAFIPELLALAQKHGVTVKSDSARVPTRDFAIRRHALPIETNLALEAAGLGTRVTLRVGNA